MVARIRAAYAVPAASAAIIAVIFLAAGAQTPPGLGDIFTLDATYHDSDSMVTISFEDKSHGTSHVILEVLGMDTSFQRQYEYAGFVEHVRFDSPPALGWKVHPVTLKVTHVELGTIGIKTEIYEPGQPKPPVIYGRP